MNRTRCSNQQAKHAWQTYRSLFEEGRTSAGSTEAMTIERNSMVPFVTGLHLRPTKYSSQGGGFEPLQADTNALSHAARSNPSR
mmetsp:Transcript_16740/g.34025  ORF Transcript_16740/g.34025 Transcript_16740/m.34025 type:complete len:84 (+) Transcript_16740:744-995(+)